MGSEPILIPDRYRVLLVDDDPGFLEDYREELEERGIKAEDIMEAANSQEAVRILKDQRIVHVAVLDKQMKDLSGDFSLRAGLDLRNHIAEHHPYVSCLMVTLDESIPDYIEAQKKGMYAYLLKDRSSDIITEVADTVYELFERRRVPVAGEKMQLFKADPLHFYGKVGKVFKNVSKDAGMDRAGFVEFDGHIWRATTKGTTRSTIIQKGAKVRGLDIEKSSIRVEEIGVGSEVG